MIFDKQNMFTTPTGISLAQSAATRVADNVIDLGVTGKSIGPGEPLELFIQMIVSYVDADANPTTTFQLFEDDDVAFGTEVKVYDSGALAEAALTAGIRVGEGTKIVTSKRYLRLKYVIATAAADTGTFIAGIIPAQMGPVQAGYETW